MNHREVGGGLVVLSNLSDVALIAGKTDSTNVASSEVESALGDCKIVSIRGLHWVIVAGDWLVSHFVYTLSLPFE